MPELPDGWHWLPRSTALQSDTSADWLIHLEVKHHAVAPSAADIEEFEQVNHLGTCEWLEWCRRNRIQRFAYFSTIKAVEARRASSVDETASGPGNTPYGASKWRGEQAVRLWAANDPHKTAIILRPAVIYGPGNKANIYAFLSSIARRRFALVGKADNLKSIVSLHNAVEGTVYLLQNSRLGSDVFNLVDRNTYSVRELAGMMSRELGVALPAYSLPLGVARAAAKAGDLSLRLGLKGFPLNSTRLEALLEHTHFSCAKLCSAGFTHPQTTEQGIRELVAWFRRE